MGPLSKSITVFGLAFLLTRSTTVCFADAKSDELKKLIDAADSVIVLESPREGAKVLFKSSKREDLNELKSALKVQYPNELVHCMCDGTPAIILNAGGKKTAQLTNHHAKLIRCNLWESDLKLLDEKPLLKWFDDRGITAPQKEYDRALKLDQEYQGAQKKWLDAMPPALKPFWPAMQSPFLRNLKPIQRALSQSIESKHDRILALFTWFGSGTGKWSGVPVYEMIPEKLLLDFETSELLDAIKGKELTPAQTEGVARLFGGFSFSVERPNDRSLLPTKLKARLLKHSLATGDEDKQGRARKAFEK
jgi:hypothetical protein